jgi:DNA modification methylase
MKKSIIVYRSPFELEDYENNSRVHPEDQIRRIERSITEFGFNNPVLVSVNKIIAGHARNKAAKNLKLLEVPTIDISHLTEEQQKAYCIADNKLQEFSEWDNGILNEELTSLKLEGFDLSLIGFDDFQLPTFDEEKDELNEDSIPEDAPERVKMGDIWLLGDHRLMCGDSTIEKDVKKLMNGELADLAHNDPPYGMGKASDGVANDNIYGEDLTIFNMAWIDLQIKYIKPNGSWYCWGIDEPLMDIYCSILKPYIREKKVTFRNLITWDKDSAIGMNSPEKRMYPTADEKCLFVMMGKQNTMQNKDDFPDEWQPLLDYLEGERKKMGWSIDDCIKITGKTSAKKYFTKSQFCLPTKEHYRSLRKASNDTCFLEDIANLKKSESKYMKAFNDSRAYFDNTHDIMNSVWHIGITSQTERKEVGGHVTPKPLELCQRAVKSSCPEGGLVIDFFGGSGSTLIACEQTGRKCYIMELTPKYCDTIVQRWENLTGQKAKMLKV